MKRVNYYLFLFSILTFGCREEHAHEIQNLKDGEFVIKLYNSKGDLLLTRKGNAENFITADNRWVIRLLDPNFAMPNSNPLETFASLAILGQSSINAPRQLQFNKDNSAGFHQRWYSLEDDWSYKSISGTLDITFVENSKIKGSFEINLEADANAQQHPFWGEHILAKGHFSSICPYENVGGCP